MSFDSTLSILATVAIIVNLYSWGSGILIGIGYLTRMFSRHLFQAVGAAALTWIFVYIDFQIVYVVKLMTGSSSAKALVFAGLVVQTAVSLVFILIRSGHINIFSWMRNNSRLGEV